MDENTVRRIVREELAALADRIEAIPPERQTSFPQMLRLGVAAVGEADDAPYILGNAPNSYRVDLSGLKGDLNSVEIRWAANLIESRLNDILSMLRAMRADRIAPQG